jgi:abequosyltransferase
MAQPLLTIVVPTYNRADCLSALLTALEHELAGLQGRVAVVIGDNASTDRTPQLAHQFSLQWADTRVLRHPTNLGAEENFCRCVEQVESPYFWIVGDDDLPRSGIVKALLALLDDVAPDMVYLSSKWSPRLDVDARGEPVTSLNAALVDQGAFARRVHVWTTFISSSVVRREFAPNAQLRRFSDTGLVHLGWVFAAIGQGRRFVYVKTPGILATLGNSGGYAILKVFGHHFMRITREAFSGSAPMDDLARAIVRRTSVVFLPGLVWGVKHANAKLGRFEASESVAAAMVPQLGSSMAYRLLIAPIGYLPRVPAAAVRFGAWVAGRLLRLYDSALEKARGTVQVL